MIGSSATKECFYYLWPPMQQCFDNGGVESEVAMLEDECVSIRVVAMVLLLLASPVVVAVLASCCGCAVGALSFVLQHALFAPLLVCGSSHSPTHPCHHSLCR